MAESNVDEVIKWLGAFVEGFNFTRPGVEQSLGRDMAKKAVEGMMTRSALQRGASATWDPNTDIPEGKGYRSRKAKRYRVNDQANVRTGDMLSQRAMDGRTTITKDQITLIYGTNDVPTRTTTGVPLSKADDKTDTEKAYYAHTGQGPHGTKRPFYELDDEIAQQVIDCAGENLNEYIRDTNAHHGF